MRATASSFELASRSVKEELSHRPTLKEKTFAGDHMSSPARGLNAATPDFSPDVLSDRVSAEAPVSPDKIRLLKSLVVELHEELESLGEVQTPDIDHGVDFYDEVARFEIELIKRALAFMGGHQRKAARLLNLRETTLSTKIKHYHIQLGRPTIVSPIRARSRPGISAPGNRNDGDG